jgi:GNAT superfamily N-acetyltransferase
MPKSAVDLDRLTVRPLAIDTWPAFSDLLAFHNGAGFGGCWCTWFHTLTQDQPKSTHESNRDLKCSLVEAGRAHAALVFNGEEAVAWAQYGPPEELPNIHHRKEYEAGLVSAPDYRITCIFVDRRYRRQGVAELALRGALDLIAKAGGGVVEGYPHDMSKQPEGKKMSSSFLYNGTRNMYEEAGFTYQRSKGQKNCVMIRTIAAT